MPYRMILALVLSSAFCLLQGQATLTSTTTSSAITSTTQSSFTLTSVTGVSVDTGLFIENEFMVVTAISGYQVTVRRPVSPTRAALHASGVQVYLGPQNYFSTYDRSGACTSTVERVLPVVNIANGNAWQCTSSVWVAVRLRGVSVTGTGSPVMATTPTVTNAHSTTPWFRGLTVTDSTTAGAVTYTAAGLLGGLITRDPNGSGRSDVTPTAALLVAAVPGATVGDSFEFTIRNTADAAETITVTAGSGATLSGTMTIAQNNSKRFLVRLDNVTSGAEAYTVYSLGTIVH
jgi:hypothetical protein